MGCGGLKRRNIRLPRLKFETSRGAKAFPQSVFVDSESRRGHIPRNFLAVKVRHYRPSFAVRHSLLLSTYRCPFNLF